MSDDPHNKNKYVHEFSSSDVELFSVIYAVTKKEPSVKREPSSGYVCFSIPYDDQVQTIINDYSGDKLMINAKSLLMARRQLFRAIKALPGGVR
jgi:hypothetical protein